MNNTVETTSEEETKDLGREIAQNVRSGDVICLYGELGSGKTTFVKGFAERLGIKSRIISPTFVVVRTHTLEIQNSKVRTQNEKVKIKKLYHLDLYRLEREDDIKGIGFADLLADKDAILIIEWPEKAGKYLPKKRIDIHFEYIDETNRIIKINR